MDYHLDQAVWAAAPTPEHRFDTLLVVGGLCGNPFAGETVRAMAAAERERLGEGSRVGVVYNGDMHWFDKTAEEFARIEELAEWMHDNGIDVFATTHTCGAAALASESGVVINNGAAGLPTFAGQRFGILTRIATRPSDDALYRCEHRGVFVEAVPVRHDHSAFFAWLDRLWPTGSPAEISYRDRIVNGPACSVEGALLGGFEVC